jgi:hypothetical protein
MSCSADDDDILLKKIVIIQYSNCNIFNNVDTNDKIQSKINICMAHSAMI